MHPAGRSAIVLGLYTGALLVLLMFCALVAANRLPGLEHYALERNAVSYTLFVIAMLLPVVRFFSRPGEMFLSAMIAWLIFVVGFDVAGMVFHNLFDSARHTPFLALLEGAVVYGVVAVGSWVGGMLIQARRHPIAPRHHHHTHHPVHRHQ
jgi:predicted MFS family arabinose efflux permease